MTALRDSATSLDPATMLQSFYCGWKILYGHGGNDAGKNFTILSIPAVIILPRINMRRHDGPGERVAGRGIGLTGPAVELPGLVLILSDMDARERSICGYGGDSQNHDVDMWGAVNGS
ncbi:hypothetical protein C8F04DRAFT_1190477 [Mycena alexandri]|uniref:Uncharacterized protein n=1 Tax=Mycena alexandri TaxID=1745969 RepID=A0AAD6SF00_9AGAR|nr:hypothetical protein C8F04DRAFT_1190477 [Mycena alexandri]